MKVRKNCIDDETGVIEMILLVICIVVFSFIFSNSRNQDIASVEVIYSCPGPAIKLLIHNTPKKKRF